MALSTLHWRLEACFKTFNIELEWCFEWNEHSLCIPSSTHNSKVAILSRMNSFAHVPIDSALPKRIAELICEWNATKLYTNTPVVQDSIFANCQHFVDELLDHLDIKLIFKGALLNYISKMREQGQCSLEYVPDVELSEKINLLAFYKFTSHHELDLFATNLVRSCSNYSIVFPHAFESDDQMLAIFDSYVATVV